jgi:hypothetical protein
MLGFVREDILIIMQSMESTNDKGAKKPCHWTEGPRVLRGTAPKGLLLLMMADFCEHLNQKSPTMDAEKMA